MKLLYFGDVYGRSGREALCARLPTLRAELAVDFVIANGENAAGGYGITAKICAQFYAAGVDVLTTGNHVWDQREILAYIPSDKRLLRPHNYSPDTPGKGVGVYTTANGKRVVVLHVMTRLYMPRLDDPFHCIAELLKDHRLGVNTDAIVFDIHGEATSEKMALGHVVDGRVTLAVGSHTHIPTADAQIFPGGTAYQTDAGMCGDYDSVIGVIKQNSIDRFTGKVPSVRLGPALGEATLCGVYVESDDATGLAVRVAPLREGGRLAPAWPV